MSPLLRDLISPDQLTSVRAPIEQARTLPREAFTSREFYDLEVERIFSRQWAAIGFMGQVPDPGDLLPVELCGIPLLLVRDDQGEVRVFHNICPYDGCLAAIDPARGQREIVVPYHGWRYDLRGRLQAIPYWDGTPKGHLEALGEKSGDLVAVRTATWNHAVFVDLSGEAVSFEEHVAPLERLLAEYRLGDLAEGVGEDGRPSVYCSPVAANWKTWAENDCINILHEGFVHELYQKSPEVPRVTRRGEKKFFICCERALIGFGYLVKDVQNTYDRPPLPHLGADPDVSPERGYFLTLFPNLTMAVTPVAIGPCIVLPEGPERSAVLFAGLYEPEAATSPEFLEVRERSTPGAIQVSQEDGRIIAAVQAARRSPVHSQRFYAPFWDEPHYTFTKMVVDALERD